MAMRNSYGLSQSSITKRIIGKRLHAMGLDAEMVNYGTSFVDYRIVIPGNAVYMPTMLHVTIYDNGTVYTCAVLYGRECLDTSGIIGLFDTIKMVQAAVAN